MTDIQLYRDRYGSLPYLSHWAAKEPAKHRFMAGNTDHWAKMKHKVPIHTPMICARSYREFGFTVVADLLFNHLNISLAKRKWSLSLVFPSFPDYVNQVKVASFSIRDTTGQVKTFHGDRMRHERHPDKKSEEKLLKFRHEIDGTLTRIGGPNFSDILVKELHGSLPGDYHKPRPLPPKLLRTAVNARAREGYIYWYMEKPPPKQGKTTFGSDKTFLGLGKRFFP